MKYKIRNQDKKNNESTLYKILRSRGIEDPYHYLNVSESDIIDPSIITNIKEAAMCLIKHIGLYDKIFINVDSDCDGYTSAAFMINWLYRTFPGYTEKFVTWGFHDDKGHGILENKISKDIKLIICPDAGSSEYEIHKRLKEKGVDIIIIDHHNADKYSEDAYVINNQLDPNYSTKTISGVMMVYKFCSYLDTLVNANHAKDMLDLASLGDIADVMSLQDYEAHELITLGLNNINNPFMIAMIAKNEYSFKGKVTPTGIAWYIAPAVNAVTRVGTNEEKECLFQAMLESKAYNQVLSTKRGHKVGETETILEQAVRICTNVKRRQDKSRDDMFESICKKIEDKDLLKNKILFIQLDKSESNTSITGLIANKLMSKYGHPVMLLNQTFDDETGELMWSGSGRNIPTEAIPSLQKFAQDSQFFELAQGHDNALGLSILDSNVDSFLRYSNAVLAKADFTPCYEIDAVYYPNKIDINDILEIADAEDIWGQGIEEPLILLEKIPFTAENICLYGSTLKLVLPDNLSAIKFNVSEDEYKRLLPKNINEVNLISIIGTCARNTGWDNGPEIKIKDYEIAGSAYYF